MKCLNQMHLRALVNISLFSNGENPDGRIADDLLNQMHLRAFVNIFFQTVKISNWSLQTRCASSFVHFN